MAIRPKGATPGKRSLLPAKAYSDYVKGDRTEAQYVDDVRSDAKFRNQPINISVLFGKKDDEDDEDNMKKIRRLAIQRKLKKQKRSK